MSFDPITLALVQKQLDHVSKYMGWAMTRTAQSPIFSESHDFSCFLSDAAGDALSVADGLPIHTGGGDFAVRAVLRDYGGDLHDGDVFLLNDPYEAGGNHLPDWTIIRPILLDGTLLGFASNRAHQSDIGGGAAGTYNAAATEIFHEGIRLPVLRLVEHGELRRDLWRLLLLNSRTPDLLDGDLAAMLGSTKTGHDKILEIARELGIERTQAVFRAVLDHAQVMMQDAIRTLPEGEYFGEDISDTDCFKTVDVAVRVRMTVKDGHLHMDFTGSSPQIRGFKNSSLANTTSAVLMGVMSFFNGRVPQNQGAMRQVSITAPLGSVVNAMPPAPMTMNTVHPTSEIVHAVWKALGRAVVDDACAGWGKTSHCISSGRNANGRTYVMYHWHGSSAPGAVKGRDGFPAAGQLCTLGGMNLPNAETYEQIYPVTVLRHEMRTDGGGAGEYRGGTGLHYEAVAHGEAQYSFRSEGTRKSTGYGINGGKGGAVGSIVLTPLDGSGEIDAQDYGVRTIGPTHIKIASSGGGGFGDPLRRPPAKVHRDVLDETVSIAAARADYGVVVDPQTLDLDLPATAALRAGMAAARQSTPAKDDDDAVA
ncbi:MAG: hydantoinase B/oxoprolinase family protein [Rhodospirillaceae bacterium]|nr:hydantoinase B/oxoprolinase family protein [Rhodospirillaceae bacterium]